MHGNMSRKERYPDYQKAWNYNTKSSNIRKSLAICATQLAGGILLKMLKCYVKC